MDAITQDIIKLLNIRYPFAKVTCSETGTLSIEAYYPKLILDETYPVDDRSEEREYLTSANEYMLALQYLAISRPEDLAQLVHVIEKDIRDKFREQYAQGKAEWERGLPCNQPHVMADAEVYKYWAQLGSWSLDHAVLLLLGRNPDTLTPDMINDPDTISEEGKPTDFAREYGAMRRVVFSHVGDKFGQLSDPVYPMIFLGWARRYNKAVPPDLIEAVTRYSAQTSDWKTLLQASEAATHALSAPEIQQAPQAQSPALKRIKPQGGDSLTPMIWDICYDFREVGQEVKARYVMAELRSRAEKLIWPLVGVVADGVKYEYEKGEQSELSGDALRKRIGEWKKSMTGD